MDTEDTEVGTKVETAKRGGRYMVVSVGSLEFSGDSYPDVELATGDIWAAIEACRPSENSSQTDHFIIDAKVGRVVWRRSECRVLLETDQPRWAGDGESVKWFGEGEPENAVEGDIRSTGDPSEERILRGGEWVIRYPAIAREGD